MSTVREVELEQRTNEYMNYLKEFFDGVTPDYEGKDFSITYEDGTWLLQYLT